MNMEKMELPKQNPESMLSAEELQEVKDLTEKINKLSLEASKLMKKIADQTHSSEDILELEEEKAKLVDQVRILSEQREQFQR